MKKLQIIFIFLLLSMIGFSGPGFPAAAMAATPGQTAGNPLLNPVLTGPTSVCLNSVGNVYTTDAGQAGYAWTVVGGIISAGGTSTDNTATVTWNVVGSKSISVNYTGATATLLPVTVNPLTASISIAASATNVIYGTAVTFTATPTNGGTTPSFQWKVNGFNAGTDSSNFTYVPSNGNAIYCLLTSNAPCVSAMFTSNVITMTVSTSPLLVTVSTKTAIPGNKVYFPVKLKGASASGTPISAAELQLTFNPAVLQYDTIINFYSGTPAAQWYYSGSSNTVFANWQEPALNTLAISDSTTLFEIRFTYIGGTSALPFTVYNFTDAQYNLINTGHIDGAVNQINPAAGYVAGDFHQHTTYTDGSYSFAYMMSKNNQFGLDWWANSEHGGGFNRNGELSGLDLGTTVYFDATLPNPIIGTVSNSGGHQNMWRWQSLRDYAFQNTLTARGTYSSKMIIQSYEMNVPGHEHASLGLVNNQFLANPNCNPLAEFEFKFDNSDVDFIGGVAQGWTKSVLTGNAKAVEAMTWLQNNYPATSYMIAAHPERKNLNNIAGFRDMNTAGPDVCFGFESMPGHQKGPDRGEYKPANNTVASYTFGGTGIYAAKVGGLWDAMLSEGRHWWLFATSDFHAEGNDFYPGEYQKNYTYVTNRSLASSYVDGLRSGNTYVVEGDLIDSLNFKVGETPAMLQYASMGQTLTTSQTSVVVKIKVRDPQGNNNNTYSSYTNPALDHIDLIRGKVGSLIAPASPNYSIDTVATSAVIARFDAVGGVSSPNGIVSQAWTDLGGGFKEITFTYNNLIDSVYFRLRGTNLGLAIANETDANGNPLSDGLMSPNSATKAYADLWFYSNPVFVAGPQQASLTGPGSVCQGSTGNVYTTDAGQTNYNWSVTGGTITAGGTLTDNTATVTWTTAGSQSISASYTGSVVTTLPVTVNSPLPVSVGIVASQNQVCLNTSVTFTATPVNGGSNPVYQWKKNGANVGSNSATHTYNPANNDIITCVLTSNATCVSGSPATSNAIVMTVYPLTASVSIAASANPVMAGTSVTFTANPVNGGTSPSFQWKVNGFNAGTGGSTFTYTPANGDAVYCLLTSNAPCVTAMFTSNLITMTVNYPVGSLLVTLPNKTAMPGDVLYYPVKLKGASASGTPISAAEIQITYDPAVLHYDTLVNFYPGTPATQWFYSGNLNTVAANWQEPGLNTLAIADSTTLFEIKFTYLGGSGSLPFTVNNFLNAVYDFIPTNHINGSVSQLVPTNNTVQNVTVGSGQSNCSDAIQVLTVAGYGTTVTVENGGSATMIAGQMISYLPGTTVMPGGYMHGFITTNGQYCLQQPNPVVNTKEEEIAAVGEKSINGKSVRVYPNPTTGNFTIEATGTDNALITKVEIYNMSGVKIITKNFDGVSKHEFSVPEFKPGVYFIHVISGNQAETIKLIKL